jgi:hypothetical protein
MPLYIVGFTTTLLTVLIFLNQRRNVARFLDGKVDFNERKLQGTTEQKAKLTAKST